MLSIPSTIKELFRQDGVAKNFRVQFRDGEYADLTNNDIVRESVAFTESACAQEVFRFGLAEASMIEFETVGVGNMLDMVILCAIEIDTTNLTAAQISAIQADPGDGTLVLVSDSDTGWGYYRVPLGTFQVTACPRNHGAMTHRRVTAYSLPMLDLARMDPVEREKLAASSYTSKAMTFRIRNYALAKLAHVSPSILSENNLTRGPGFGVFGTGSTRGVYLQYSKNGTPGLLAISPTHYIHNLGTDDCIWGIENTEQPSFREAVTAFIVQYAEAQGITFTNLPAGSSVHDYVYEQAAQPMAVCFYHKPTLPQDFVTPITDSPAYYSYMGGSNANGWVIRPYQLAISIGPTEADQTTIQTISNPGTDPAFAVYQWEKNSPTVTDPFENIQVTYDATSYDPNGNGYTAAYDPIDLVRGFLELQAVFATENRVTGGCSIKRLSQATPLELLPADYSELWWDEYDVSPIGAINFIFGASGKETAATYRFGDGLSVYDMSDNEVLRHFYKPTKAKIQALLQSAFVPYAQSVAYTPMDLSMRGMPFAEAGDAMEITAEEGTVVTTYMLRRTLSGIQALIDEADAAGGEIMEA